MVFKEGTYLKATLDGKNVSGYVMFDKNNDPFLTGNNKVKLSNLKNIVLSEASEEDIDEIVNNDLERLDQDKVKKIKDKEVDSVSQAREKELQKAGVKIKKGDYADKFAAGLKAMSVFSGVAKGDITMSDALKKYESTSEETDLTSIREGDTTLPLQGDLVTAQKEDDEKDIIEDPKDPVDAAITEVSSDDDNYMVDEEATEEKEDVVEDKPVELSRPTSVVDQPTYDTVDDFMNNTEEVATTDEFLSKDPLTDEETDEIASAISGDAFDDKEEDLTLNDDVVIKISNPKDLPINIEINGKEETLNNEIDEELDNFKPEDGESFTEEAFLEHLCKKYSVSKESILKENCSIEQGICNLITEVASR